MTTLRKSIFLWLDSGSLEPNLHLDGVVIGEDVGYPQTQKGVFVLFVQKVFHPGKFI